jgi:hypothetical protein
MATATPLNAAASIAVELEKVQAMVYPQFMSDCLLYNRMQNFNNYKVSDRLTRIPLLAQPGSTFGQFDPDGVSDSMGLGGAEQYIVGVASIVYFNQAVQVTKRAEWATDGSVKAVTDVYKDAFKINLKQFRTNLESLLCFSDGSGVIGTLLQTPPSSTQQNFLQVNNSNSFQAGSTYQVFAAGYGTNRGVILVASVDSANNIIYLVLGGAGGSNYYPTGTIATDVFLVSGAPGGTTVDYQPDSYTSATVSASLNGIPLINFNSVGGTWFGVDKTTPGVQGVLNPAYVSGDNDALTPQIFQELESFLQRQNGSDADELLNYFVTANVDQITAWENYSLYTNDFGTAFRDQDGSESKTRKDGLAKGRVKTMAGHEIIGNGNIKAVPQRIDLLNEKYLGRTESRPASLFEVGGVTVFPAWNNGIAPVSLFYYVIGTQTFTCKPRAGAYSDNLLNPLSS